MRKPLLFSACCMLQTNPRSLLMGWCAHSFNRPDVSLEPFFRSLINQELKMVQPIVQSLLTFLGGCAGAGVGAGAGAGAGVRVQPRVRVRARVWAQVQVRMWMWMRARVRVRVPARARVSGCGCEGLCANSGTSFPTTLGKNSFRLRLLPRLYAYYGK